MFTKILLLISILGLTNPVFGQSNFFLSGKVTDSSGKSLSYASVALDNTRYGTLTDENGKYKLQVPEGLHTLTIGFLGYETLELTLDIKRNTNRNFELKPEELFIEEVLITQDGRDPAYSIIRLAIDNKKNNERPFKAYSHHAYTKSTIGFPQNFDLDSMFKASPFGAAIENPEEELQTVVPEMESKILYLSENISQVFIREPQKEKEKILSSRVSGNAQQFSFIGNLANRYTPYENRLVMEGVSDRGIISPISDNAFFTYDYKLLGTIKEGGMQSYKIQVIPKRAHDPAFRGVVYIADSSYAVKKLDMFITHEQQIDVLDTLRIRQEYMTFQQKWVPFQTEMSLRFSLDLLGFHFPFSGKILTMVSEYEIETDIPKRFFGNEKLVIEDTAVGHTITFWDTLRPIPLTQYEDRDYQLKDSLEQARNSPAYLDSLSQDTRKISFQEIVMGGHTFKNFRKKTSFTLFGLMDGLTYNPMEGIAVEYGFRYQKEFNKKHTWTIEPKIRYGFGNEKLSYLLSTTYTGNVFRQEKITLSGGDYITQFSRFSQIDPRFNDMYILFKQNFLKLYQKKFAEATYQTEILNGLTGTFNARYENRSRMPNVGDWSLFHKDADEYRPNLSFSDHDALVGEVSLAYKPFNTFMRTPDGKVNLGSAFPTLHATFTHAFQFISNRAADFTKITGGISHTSTLGLLGQTQWRIMAGKFISTDRVYFPDRFHVKGNETFLSTGGFDEFYLLPYYEIALTQPFVEAHAEHAFGGFLLNKIPGVRKLKLKEYVGAHYLIREDGKPYLEMNAGLEALVMKIIPLRFDVNVRVLGKSEGRQVYFKWVVPLEALGILN